jgi:hypothetical protein
MKNILTNKLLFWAKVFGTFIILQSLTFLVISPISFIKPVVLKFTKPQAIYSISLQEYKILRDKNTSFTLTKKEILNYCIGKIHPNHNSFQNYFLDQVFVSIDELKGQITSNCYLNAFG